MAEKKRIEDGDLDKVAGGYTKEEKEAFLEEVDETIKNVGKSVQNLGNTLELISKAAETNTCPICNKPILPGATTCQPVDFIRHAKLVHYSK